MRKNYFVLLLALAMTMSSFGTAKKVAYVTFNKAMDATATTVDNDPIIQVLKADPNIDLTVMLAAADAVINNLADFDVVVVQESFNSAAAILKPTGSLGIANMPVPFVYNKTFALQRNDRAMTASTATANESGSLTITVEAGAVTNDLFKACTVGANNDIKVLNATAADLGAAGTKALNFNRGHSISNATLLAQPTGTTDATVAINDMPPGTTIDSETLTSRMIAISMNFGAISANNGRNITDDGLTIWRNAVYILAGLPVPDTKASLSTSIDQVRDQSEIISVRYFNLSGIEVFEPSELAKGIYIQRTGYRDGSLISTKVFLGR